MLGDILTATRRRVEEQRAVRPQHVLERLAASAPPALDLAAALRRPGVQLIAEIKRRSPSRGSLHPDLNPAALAVAYGQGGAAAVSVLTEPAFFGGSLDDLAAARAGLRCEGQSLPILRKDFILDPYQVAEARAHGADAVLLIVAALSGADLRRLYGQACALGLSVLVEVHNEAELDQALAMQPSIVGINSRNLHDMTVDLTVVERLRPLAPAGVLVVAESGIHSVEDVRRLRSMNVDAMLVGEALVRAANPAELTRQFVEAGQ